MLAASLLQRTTRSYIPEDRTLHGVCVAYPIYESGSAAGYWRITPLSSTNEWKYSPTHLKPWHQMQLISHIHAQAALPLYAQQSLDIHTHNSLQLSSTGRCLNHHLVNDTFRPHCHHQVYMMICVNCYTVPQYHMTGEGCGLKKCIVLVVFVARYI
jgi:hypothetical protein